MTQPHGEPGAKILAAESPDELRQQVDHTRQELGETVEAFAGKTDVKACAEENAAEIRELATLMAGRLKSEAARRRRR